MRFLLKTIITGLFFTGLLAAQNIPAFPIGEMWQFPDARTLALGGAGSVSNTSASALILNPAAMGNSKSGFHLQLSPTFRSQEERRSFPVYDRFEGYLTDGIYVVNDNWYNGFQGSAQYSFSNLPILKSVALGSFTENDQNYSYEEEVRANDFDDEQMPLAYNKIKYDGQLQRFSFGAALTPMNGLDVGLSVGILSGDLSAEEAVVFVEPSENDFFLGRSRNLDGSPILLAFGAVYDVHAHMKIGTHIRLPYTVKYDLKSFDTTGNPDFVEETGTEAIEYPIQFNIGMEYRGNQALQARLNVDLVYEQWSNSSYQLNDEVVAENFEDVIQVKTGIEHIFFNQVPFQVGLQYRTFFSDRTQTRFLFTSGTGFIGQKWQVDVAGGFGNIEYRTRDLFDDIIFGGDRSGSPNDTVKEANFFGMMTLKVNVGR